MRKTLHCLMAVCMFHVTTFLLLSELKAGFDQSLQAPLLSEGGESEEMTQPARLSDFRSVFTQPSGGRNMFRGGGLDEEDKKLLGLEDAESTAAKAAGWETDSDFDVELDAEVQRQYHRKGGGAGKDSKPVDFSKVREDLQRINPDQREGGDSEDSESLTAFNERVQRDLELAGSGSTNIVVGSDTRPVVEVV